MPKKPITKKVITPKVTQSTIDSVANVVKNINSTKADFFRNSLPLPENASQLLAKLTGDARMSNASLNDQEKSALYHTILNAQKRTGKLNGGTEYEDYQNPNGSAEDFNSWFNKGKNSVGTIVSKSGSKNDPYYTMASTVGRGRYWTDPKTKDVYYTDVYDWNSKEGNFSGKNLYQNARNLVRTTEDKNLNKEKNDSYRMGFKFNPKEMEEIDKKLEENKKSGADLGARMLDLGIQKNGGYLGRGYDPTDRPGGPLISYYAKKGGKLPQANFTDYTGSQMYGKGGEMIKRKDGSYSQRGLWDNIRANKGSGKKPTKEMLKQESKIENSYANGGMIFQNPVGMATKIAQNMHLHGGPLLVENQHVAMGGSLKAMYDQGGALNVAYGQGGGIHIKPENKGKFTSWAKSHDMGVQEAASHVMANKEDYSSTIVKRANFAKNAAGWKHAFGGKVNPYRLNIAGQGLKMYGGGGTGLFDNQGEGINLGQQTLFSTYTQNSGIPSGLTEEQLKQLGIFQLDPKQNTRPPVGDTMIEDKKPTFDPGNLYSGVIQAGSSLVGNMAQKNQLKAKGSHDDGSADDVIGAAKGMGKGAAMGAKIGSVIPGVGTAIGAGAGAVIGGVAGYFQGKKTGAEKKKNEAGWQANYMKTEQNRINANSSRYQDFKPTNSGYYRNGGKVKTVSKYTANPKNWVKELPLTQRKFSTPVFDRAHWPVNDGPVQREDFTPAVNYIGNVAMQTAADQNLDGKAYNIAHTGMDAYKLYKNKEYLKAAGLMGSEFIKLNTPIVGDAVINAAQEAVSPSPNFFQQMENEVNTVSGSNFQNFSPKKKAAGGSLAKNFMAQQKAVGGNLVPLSSDAVEVKGPSHANGGVKLPEMGAEVEGKEVIKDDYVFSDQLGFAKEAKRLAKAKGTIENKPASRERINTLKLLQDKENQLKLAQEYIRKQYNLA